MSSLNKRKSSILLIFLTIFPVLFNIIISNLYLIEINQQINSDNSKIRLTQGTNSNFSIESNYPRLIWIEGVLNLEIKSNLTGEINIAFLKSPNGDFFINHHKKEELESSGKKLSINILIKPDFLTLPGKYKFRLFISHSDSGEKYLEDLNIILGMGYVIIITVLIIFGTALIIILTVKGELEEQLSITSTQNIGRLPEGKIKCPECKRLIDEGLSFCPECGERIPEFLRFNPNSPTGLS